MSNFLIWQGANAFFWVTPTPWPDFDLKDVQAAIAAWNRSKTP